MSNFYQIALNSPDQAYLGETQPRIRSKPVDLPSRGQEMIDFCESIGFELLPWQKFLAIEMHRVKPDGRWHHNEIGVLVARQNGKSNYLALRI